MGLVPETLIPLVGPARPKTGGLIVRKLLSEVSVNDTALSANKKRARVTGIYPHDKKPVYRVTLRSGPSIICDGSHKWLVCFDHAIETGWFVKTTEELASLIKEGSIYLPRFEQFDIKSRKIKQSITRVEPWGESETISISVDHPDKLFLVTEDHAGDYVVTRSGN